MHEDIEPPPLDITKPQAVLIHYYGLFMVTWSVLESVIQTAIMKELGVGAKKTIIITGKLQFNPRIQMLVALLKLHGETHQEAIKTLNKIESFSQRNTIVHGLVIVGDPKQLTFVKYDGGGSTKRSFTPLEMQKHIMGLSERITRLQNLLKVTDEDMQLIGDATLESAH